MEQIPTKSIKRSTKPIFKFLNCPSFQEVNTRFVLPFKNENDRKVSTGYYLPKVEIKDYIVMIDGRNFFDQTVNNYLITYDIIKNMETG